MMKQDLSSCLILALILMRWISGLNGLIRNCYPDTDERREKELIKYAGLKEFLETSKDINGRLGDLKLVNWQDPILKVTLEEKRLGKGLAGVTCVWRMWSPYKKEQTEFNEKGYVDSNELHADPVNCRSSFRTLSCETAKCVQYWNIFVRYIPNYHLK
jgi:hypothetical protein